MDARPVLERIEDIVSEEHRLWSDAEAGRLTPEGHERLAELRVELDRAWDLLRRRRLNPDAPEEIPAVPDPPNDQDGPEPEPMHLEHWLHADGAAPDPGIPRDIP
jgi:hypothetical protein